MVQAPIAGDVAVTPLFVVGAVVQAPVAGDAAVTPTATNRAPKRRRLSCLDIFMAFSVYDSCSSAEVTLSKDKWATRAGLGRHSRGPELGMRGELGEVRPLARKNRAVTDQPVVPMPSQDSP